MKTEIAAMRPNEFEEYVLKHKIVGELIHEQVKASAEVLSYDKEK